MSNIIDFPITDSLKPEQAIAAAAKMRWTQFIGIGLTADGEYEIINSEMSAERALWLVEWAKRWAMGLEDGEEE